MAFSFRSHPSLSCIPKNFSDLNKDAHYDICISAKSTHLPDLNKDAHCDICISAKNTHLPFHWLKIKVPILLIAFIVIYGVAMPHLLILVHIFFYYCRLLFSCHLGLSHAI